MIGWLILAVLAVLILTILIRGAMFKPSAAQAEDSFDDITVDNEEAVANLQKLVRCRTISYEDSTLEDDKEFEKLTGMLPSLYPEVIRVCEEIPVHKRAKLYLWKGKNHGKPEAEASVLMAHYDVVPVEEDAWEKPPFEGLIEYGILWGRGTLDTKVTFNGILTAANRLIKEGFVPENDIYLAFSGSEEIQGPGAAVIADFFQKNSIRLSMVVDEGGAVVENVFPGVTKPCALIGIAEKGIMNLRLSTKSAGGHASAPKPHTPVGVLADAVKKTEDHPLPMHLTAPALKMFDIMGRESTFLYRIIFANLWLFKPALDALCKKTGGELNALVRTTVAFTQMEGSKAPNVIPPSASVVANVRINPADTTKSVIADLQHRIGNDAVTIESIGNYAIDPSPVSRTDVEGWERVVRAVKGTWRGTLVAPYLMVQCSDSRHYRDISDRVYKFSAMHLTKEERGLIHGSNERITLPAVGKAVEFFYRLIRES
ncbi:MAG: M20/M25/M40 family metallo-hydrolase [Lachnospiraceae bacterium]|nr:M20/M25/M40 family metallo-hydrolase [Lachnospiraceae bacterium]